LRFHQRQYLHRLIEHLVRRVERERKPTEIRFYSLSSEINFKRCFGKSGSY